MNAQSNTDEILFFDDFTGDDLDRSKWTVEVTGTVVNREQQAYVDSNETIYLLPDEDVLPSDDSTNQRPENRRQASEKANGVLVLQPRWKPGYRTVQGRRFDFISGRLNTRGKVEISSGSISAKMKLPVGSGLWPAFWALGIGRWPACGEIDIMESVGEPDWISAGAHGSGYCGDAALVNYRYFHNDENASTWHIYSVDWDPSGGIYFRVDGELIYRITRPMIEYFGPWAFDQPKYIILNFALGGNYPFKINGVRNPYLGLPEETAQLIRRNEVRLCVDWVKVSRLPSD
jgi:beta-glucanase (GH16 family)